MDKHYCCDGTFMLKDKEGHKYKLTVEQDECTDGPREWDNVATLLTWSRNYELGDTNNYEDLQAALEDLADKVGVKYDEIDYSIKGAAKARDTKLIEDLKPYYCIKYLYLLDHSGISISTSDFGDPWDSGVVGFAYISKERAFNEFVDVNSDNWYKRASEKINDEVKILDMYLQGDVYWYKLEEEILQEEKCPHCGEVIRTYTEWVEQDSCGGFYGGTLEESDIIDSLSSDLEFVEEK